jgi:hypothetical protein
LDVRHERYGMATHVFPDLEKQALISYINSPKLKLYAGKAADLLKCFPQLKVWEVQYKGQGIADTAWYIGFNSKNDPYIMNFKIVPSNLNVEFRFSQYLPESIFELLNWQNSSWRYADFKKFGTGEVQSMIKQYLVNIQSDFNDGKLKQGGRSFAEKMIQKTLKNIFPETDILTNNRPDVLRSSLDKPLELDLYLPRLNLAIEIQGPQHFREIYGSNIRLKENDLTKKKWCEKNGIKLVWMNWEGITRDLLKLSIEERVEQLELLLNHFLSSKHLFMWWKDVEMQQCE